ncbi:helix-turn-helix domain-containing protein [Bradyrhizobium sp. GCM10028915]|uniref:helix-turn-helix domain-containing protein n=1 Tax=Bradyrhizobium sp. GCM10028915 TaxID=3273385 RepID=UPI00360E92E9
MTKRRGKKRHVSQPTRLADTDNLHFTQEFLAEMLGVKRTSVTLHARTLQQAGMINYFRGHIQITDVEGLQESVCECYATVKSYYKALLGPHTV